MSEAYYQVPAFTARSIRFERGGRLGVMISFPAVEETALDHAAAAVLGLAVFAMGTALPSAPVGIAAMLIGGFWAGFAANNTLIAARCEREEVTA